MRPKVHRLKLDQRFYWASERGLKNFEIRKNDRDFKVGDILELRECLEGCDGYKYTGANHYKRVNYIMDDGQFLPEGYVCMAVTPIDESEVENDA